MVLQFHVNKQIITAECPGRLVVADSRDVVKAQFVLDAEWDGLAVTALFANDFVSSPPVEVLLTSEEPVAVPPEMLAAGQLRVSLVGLGNGGQLRLTTKFMDKPIRVYRSGPYTGISAEEVTPDLWEQVLAAMGDLGGLETADKSSLVAAINEAAKTGAGGGGGTAKGAVLYNAPQELTDEQKAQARENIGAGGPQVQADWSQGDPTAADYVKNRTHYEDLTDAEALWTWEAERVSDTELLLPVDWDTLNTYGYDLKSVRYAGSAYDAVVRYDTYYGKCTLDITGVGSITLNPDATGEMTLTGSGFTEDAYTVEFLSDTGSIIKKLDARFLPAETDPTVPVWAKAVTKPTYTAEEVGARPDTWTPSAEDVGARPDTWVPSAADVGAVPVPATATVGQTIQVTAVDAEGKPTAWEAVDLPKEEEWELIADITLTEQVTSFNIDTDQNGEAFTLKKYKLAYAWAPVTDGTTIPGFMFHSENGITTGPNAPILYTSAFAAASPTLAVAGEILSEILPGNMKQSQCWRHNATTSGGRVDPFSTGEGSKDIRNAIKQYDGANLFTSVGGSNGVLAVGSRIALWGIRA